MDQVDSLLSFSSEQNSTRMKQLFRAPFIMGILSNLLLNNAHAVTCEDSSGSFSEIISSNSNDESSTCYVGNKTFNPSVPADCNVIDSAAPERSWIKMKFQSAIELQTVYVVGLGDGATLIQAELYMYTEGQADSVWRRCPQQLQGSGFYRCPSHQGFIDGLIIGRQDGAEFQVCEVKAYEEINLVDYLQASDTTVLSGIEDPSRPVSNLVKTNGLTYVASGDRTAYLASSTPQTQVEMILPDVHKWTIKGFVIDFNRNYEWDQSTSNIDLRDDDNESIFLNTPQVFPSTTGFHYVSIEDPGLFSAEKQDQAVKLVISGDSGSGLYIHAFAILFLPPNSVSTTCQVEDYWQNTQDNPIVINRYSDSVELWIPVAYGTTNFLALDCPTTELLKTYHNSISFGHAQLTLETSGYQYNQQQKELKIAPWNTNESYGAYPTDTPSVYVQIRMNAAGTFFNSYFEVIFQPEVCPDGITGATMTLPNDTVFTYGANDDGETVSITPSIDLTPASCTATFHQCSSSTIPSSSGISLSYSAGQILLNDDPLEIGIPGSYELTVEYCILDNSPLWTILQPDPLVFTVTTMAWATCTVTSISVPASQEIYYAYSDTTFTFELSFSQTPQCGQFIQTCSSSTSGGVTVATTGDGRFKVYKDLTEGTNYLEGTQTVTMNGCTLSMNAAQNAQYGIPDGIVTFELVKSLCMPDASWLTWVSGSSAVTFDAEQSKFSAWFDITADPASFENVAPVTSSCQTDIGIASSNYHTYGYQTKEGASPECCVSLVTNELKIESNQLANFSFDLTLEITRFDSATTQEIDVTFQLETVCKLGSVNPPAINTVFVDATIGSPTTVTLSIPEHVQVDELNEGLFCSYPIDGCNIDVWQSAIPSDHRSDITFDYDNSTPEKASTFQLSVNSNASSSSLIEIQGLECSFKRGIDDELFTFVFDLNVNLVQHCSSPIAYWLNNQLGFTVEEEDDAEWNLYFDDSNSDCIFTTEVDTNGNDFLEFVDGDQILYIDGGSTSGLSGVFQYTVTITTPVEIDGKDTFEFILEVEITPQLVEEETEPEEEEEEEAELADDVFEIDVGNSEPTEDDEVDEVASEPAENDDSDEIEQESDSEDDEDELIPTPAWVPNWLRSSDNQDPEQMPPPTYDYNVGSDGHLKLEFTELMTWPEELDPKGNSSRILTATDFFNITYVQSEDSIDQLTQIGLSKVRMDWSVVQVDDNAINLLLTFTNPVGVSYSRIHRDLLDFKILKPELFTGGVSGKELQLNEIEEIFLPQQINGDSASTVAAVESTQTGAIKAFVSGNLVVSIVLSLSLGQMIGALNAIQILVLTILFRLDIPVNLHDILGPILKLSNFDVFQTDLMFAFLFGFQDSESFDGVFDDSGFEGSNFIVGIGPLFVMVVVFVVWVPLQLLLKWFVVFKKIKTSKIGKYLLTNGSRRFQVMTFAMEGTLEIGFTACITIIVASRNENTVLTFNQTGWDWFAYILAIGALISLIIAPIDLSRAAYYVNKIAVATLAEEQANWEAKNQLREQAGIQYDDEQPKEKDRKEQQGDEQAKENSEEESSSEDEESSVFSEYIALFEDYKPEKWSSIAFYMIFFIRRFLLIYTLVIQPEKILIGCFLHIMSTLFMACYIAVYKPYSDQSRNLQEFGNEVTILLSIYCMTGYTDFLNSDQGRFDEGRMCELEDSNGLIALYPHEQCPQDYLQSMKNSHFMIGWLALSIAGINIFANIGLMSITSLKGLKNNYTQYKARKNSKKYLVEGEPRQNDPLPSMTERERTILKPQKSPIIGDMRIVERERAITELQKDPLIGNMWILEREELITELQKDPLIGNMQILEAEQAVSDLKNNTLIGRDWDIQNEYSYGKNANEKHERYMKRQEEKKVAMATRPNLEEESKVQSFDDYWQVTLNSFKNEKQINDDLDDALEGLCDPLPGLESCGYYMNAQTNKQPIVNNWSPKNDFINHFPAHYKNSSQIPLTRAKTKPVFYDVYDVEDKPKEIIGSDTQLNLFKLQRTVHERDLKDVEKQLVAVQTHRKSFAKAKQQKIVSPIVSGQKQSKNSTLNLK